MTKEKVEQLIDKLSLEKIDIYRKLGKKTVNISIRLGFMIEIIAKQYRDDEFKNELLNEAHLYRHSEVPELCALWQPCDTELSLQEIINKSGWEPYEECECGSQYQWGKSRCTNKCSDHSYTKSYRLKNPAARALIEYIDSLNLK